MRLSFDREADAISLWLKDTKLDVSKEVAPRISLHYDHNGEVASIAIIAASRYGGRPLLEHMDIDFSPAYEPLGIEVDLPQAVEERLFRHGKNQA
ncbi:MAG: DUF2283 domain-containing protein [Dehalococcoidia bacterium]|nr:DUF2283 domain-containing protein [Dehalococcoidia bacterium]